MKGCTIFGINIPNDKTGKIAETIDRVSGSDSIKSKILASYVNDANFLKYVEADLGKKITDLAEINGNTLGRLFNSYYKEQHLSVKNYATNKNIEVLNGFSSSTAKAIAIEYCADLVINSHFANRDNPKFNRSTTKANLLSSIINNITSNFLYNYTYTLAQSLNNKIAEDFLNTFEERNKKIEYYDEHFDELSDEQLDKLEEEINELGNKEYLLAQNLVSKYGNERHKNYANLVSVMRANPNEWFTKVLNHTKMLQLKKDYLDIVEGSDFYDENYNDELDSSNPDADTVDEMSKFWEDKLAANFEKVVGVKIRMYLDTVKRLSNNTFTKNDKGKYTYAYDTNNELGVSRTVGARFLITNIHAFGNFYSVDEFIDSIEEMSNIPGLECCIKIANDMKDNPQFANEVFCALAHPKLNKSMITMTTNGIEFNQSNPSIDALTYHTYKMFNSVKNKFTEYYDEQDKNNILSILNEVIKTDNNEFNNSNIEIKANEAIKNIFKKYFHHVDINVIDRIVITGNNRKENYANLLNQIITLLNTTGDLIPKYRDYQEQYRNELSEWGKEKREFEKENPFKSFTKPRPKFNPKNVNFDNIYAPVIEIAKKVSKYSVAKNELNSTNAEGKQASDLGKNCYISNLIEQIQYGNEENQFAGLKALRQEILKNPIEYKYNTLFFGIKDKEGNYIKQGLFIEKDGEIIINPNAKKLISVTLFDGIKDSITGNASMYSAMSKGDYFMANIIAYINPIRTGELIGVSPEEVKKDFAGYFLRTPSDAPKNFILNTIKYRYDDLFINGDINTNNEIYRVFLYNLINELNVFIDQLNNVFERNKNDEYITKDNTNGLLERVHFNGDIVSNGKLTGNFFKFIKLFKTNNYDANAEMQRILSLYGGVNAMFIERNGKLVLNKQHPLLNVENGRISLKTGTELENILEEIVTSWITSFSDEITERLNDYTSLLENNDIPYEIAVEAIMNGAITEMNMDALFEGDSKYYKSAKDFLKRAKEIQAGGDRYTGFNMTDLSDKGIEELKKGTVKIAVDEDGKSWYLPRRKDEPLKARNGFRAITINNTVRSSYFAPFIEQELTKILTDKFGDEAVAAKQAKEIAKGYTETTKVNDAQSYITLDEFVRRRYADGTLSQYKDVLEEIMAVRRGEKSIKDIDVSKINGRIQVQKNFYFDKKFDEVNGIHYSRQIKNAEFVLIPEFIEGTELGQLYEIMEKYGIDQINTRETSKAANKNILTFWDNDGKINPNFEQELIANDSAAIDDFYYRYLYKQQDVPQHLEDAKNKAGIQVMKKIIDNSTEATEPYIEKLFRNYCANIKSDFKKLIYNMGWKVDANGNILDDNGIPINRSGNNNINFDEFWSKARDEAQRLGMDSNFIEYLTPAEIGLQPNMPNFMNNVQTKLESIAQALFNSGITRQTLPGWHAAQVTSVGFGAKTADGKFRTLEYHPFVNKETGESIRLEEYKKLSDEEKKNYKQAAYAEIMLPRWSNMIGKEITINDLAKAGLDIQIGYRIPTEGKQSVSVFKVVDYLDDVYGSTVMVPDEWITQTGSDFDVDSIYAICFHMYKDKDGKLHKIELDTEDTIKGIERRYSKYVRNLLNDKVKKDLITDEFVEDKYKKLYEKLKDIDTIKAVAKEAGIISIEEFSKLSIEEQNTKEARDNEILQAMINIMSSPDAREENYARSNFDKLGDAKKICENALGITSKSVSTYNPFDQIDFMGNATSGMDLKARSVSRDNFVSINNRVKTMLNIGHEIVAEYNPENYSIDTAIKNYGLWSKNNPNGCVLLLDKDGKLLNNTEYKNKDVAKIRVQHKMFGHSLNDNRNIVGQLITTYSSQTTAHILDVIKEGTIYNENNYTFGTFKTLIDVGIDFNTAVAFLMQPAVTRIVNNYHSANSMFTEDNKSNKNSVTHVNKAIKDLAIELGLKDITERSSLKSIINTISTDERFQFAFKKLFGVNISQSKPINEQSFALDFEKLLSRLEQANINNKSVSLTEDERIEQAAFDIAMLFNFKQYFTTTQKLEKLVQCCNPDKFGAKQTIRSTRSTLENIEEYSGAYSETGNVLIAPNGKNLLNNIYAKNEEGVYTPELSPYPYLCAFLKYATVTSVDVNSNLFTLENEKFVSILKDVQEKLGIRFNDKQYKDYIQYIITSSYQQIPMLTEPQTITKEGYIVTNDRLIKEQNSSKYWNEEISRIFGYDITQSGDIYIANPNKPNEDEIYSFCKLTPAQKVRYIQTTFKDKYSIFDEIEVNLFNQNEFKTKGFSSQKLRFNENLNNIEDLFIQFREAFFSNNPLIKLAALDIIKYAFLVEGFKFKKGGMSKIITNDSLYGQVDKGATSIIDVLKQNIQQFQDISDAKKENFIDRFVRSHSEYINNINLGSIIVKKNNTEKKNNATIFNECITFDGIVKISYIEANEGLIKKLTLDSESSPKDYIRITTKKYGEKTTTLYKVNRDDPRFIYLIPLNLLEANETIEFSANKHNNIYKDYNYYKEIINESLNLADGVFTYYKDTDKTLLNEKRANFTIAEHKHSTIVEHDENIFIKLKENETHNVRQVELDNFSRSISEALTSPVEGQGAYYVVKNNNIDVAKFVNDNNGKLFNIPVNGNIVPVVISKYKLNSKVNTAINNYIKNRKDFNKIPLELQFIAKELQRTQGIITNLYKIEIVRDKSVVDEVKDIENEVNEAEDDDIRSQRTNGFTELIEENASNSKLDLIDDVAQQLYKEIKRQSNINDNDRLANKVVERLAIRGFDSYSEESIKDNEANIYREAADYYSAMSNILIDHIDKFTTEDGQVFSIDDPRLYLHLNNYPNDYHRLIKVLLDAKTFGEQFYDIFNLNVEGITPDVADAINKIRTAINRVRNSSKLAKGMEYLFNIYIANNFADNPNVREGLISLRESFGDINWFDLNFSDIGELNNQQVQSIVKLIYQIIDEASMILAPEAAQKFNDDWDSIVGDGSNFNIDHVVDKQGRIVRPYNDKFLEDEKALNEEVNEAKEKDENSLEYYRAKLKRDKWRAKHKYQPVVKEYYDELNEATENVLNNAGDYYIEYMRLIKENYKLQNKNWDELTDEEKQTINNNRLKIISLKSLNNFDGSEKPYDEQAKVHALNTFIDKKRELNKQYFVDKQTETFKIILNQSLDYIKEYDINNPDKTIDEKLQNDRYRECYYWIKRNTIFDLNSSDTAKINAAFQVLKDASLDNDLVLRDIIRKDSNYQNALNDFGELDPRKLTPETIAAIKAEREKRFGDRDSMFSDRTLIKNIPTGLPIYTDDFYRGIRGPEEGNKSPRKYELITKINALISKTIQRDGIVSAQRIFEGLTREELIQLRDYYRELREIKSGRTKEQMRQFLNLVEFKNNDDAYNTDVAWAEMNLTNEDKILFNQIFKDVTEEGEIIPNREMYGYIVPKTTSGQENEYINKAKTNARNLIEKNITFTPTEYYYAARKEAQNNGTFKEWFDANHIYNPYTHKYEPLSIWTKMEVIPGGELSGEYNYNPTFENLERNIKDGTNNEEQLDYRNSNYQKNSKNFNPDNAYNNNIRLTDKEKQIIDLLQRTINGYVSNYRMKQFAKEGFMPRRRKTKTDANYYLGQALGSVGLEFRNTNENKWHDDVDYANDFDAEFDMTELLKGKGYQKLPERPKQEIGEDKENYNERLAKWKEEYDKIKAENLKIDNEVLDRDWKNVMIDFIKKATIYNARERAKNTAYLLLEDLKDNPAYKTSRFTGKVIEDKKKETDASKSYQTIDNKNTIDIARNWIRRVIFNEYKKASKLRNAADFAQNMTSAKYMIFNITGGIANVGTGMANIFNEVFARDYFNYKEFNQGRAFYFRNMPQMIRDMYSPTSNNKAAALTKFFNIVDFDAFTERRPNEMASEYVKRIRDGLYALQSGGEHFMQNTVLFAMLKSHRKFTDIDGTIKFGNINEFIWRKEREVLINLIQNDEIKFNAYKNFLKKIDKNLKEKQDYAEFRKDLNEEFLREIGDKELIKQYIINKKKAIKEAEKEFNNDTKHPTMDSCLEVKNGYIKIIPDSGLTSKMCAAMRRRVIQVNKKIHGVYDKEGAAKIESEWWGGLVMQYHKHIYPGIMKRWRRKGYFNELRGTVEKGSYISLYDFLATDFKGIGKRIHENESNIVLASIQEIFKSVVDTCTNIGMNWNIMPEWEKHNIMRVLGDLAGMTAAVIIAMSIYALTDDDDLDESEAIATMLYISDRLLAEAQMYNPYGLATEAKTLWSSPIAAQNLPKDIIKALEYTARWMYDEDFNIEYTTGLYKGQNKLSVLFTRNTPAYRIYKRLANMTRNNSYYRINENALNMKIAKMLADGLVPD